VDRNTEGGPSAWDGRDVESKKVRGSFRQKEAESTGNPSELGIELELLKGEHE